MKVLLIIAATVGVAFSAIYFKVENGKYCEYETQKILPGEKYQPPGQCMEINCDSNAALAEWFTCPPKPIVDDPDSFVEVTNHQLPYPKCCPTVKPKNKKLKDNLLKSTFEN